MAETLCFEYLLGSEGLRQHQAVQFDDDGRITHIKDTDPALCEAGLAIPGIPNAHSHSFQRALTGFGEVPNVKKQDTFWSWRSYMYALANQLDPDQLYKIARQAFMEMLQAGFTSVAEFHYLHHTKEGESSFEMAEAILLAARDTGIRLRLLPVLYMRGGFALPAQPEHYRFVFPGLSQYCKLLEYCKAQGPTGIAPHSLRAVPAETLAKLTLYAGAILGKEYPAHIHVAEQKQEVEECLAAYQASPVQKLADTVKLTAQWNVVHATHVNGREVNLLARSDAQVVLCPFTEAYLGDGIFPAGHFIHKGGHYAIGTDSNTRIDAFGELRLLEYVQRLVARKRSCLATEQGLGQGMWEMAAKSGARSVQFEVGEIKVGNFADIVVLDTQRAPLNGLPAARLLDAAVIGGSRDLIKTVYVSGQEVVTDGLHMYGEEIEQEFAHTLKGLKMP